MACTANGDCASRNCGVVAGGTQPQCLKAGGAACTVHELRDMRYRRRQVKLRAGMQQRLRLPDGGSRLGRSYLVRRGLALAVRERGLPHALLGVWLR